MGRTKQNPNSRGSFEGSVTFTYLTIKVRFTTKSCIRLVWYNVSVVLRRDHSFRLEGPRARIPWSLRVMLKRRVLCQKMVSPRDDPLDILAEDLKKCQFEDESHELPTVISQLSNRCRFL